MLLVYLLILVTTSTVDEHFNTVMTDDRNISPRHSEVSFENLPDWYDEKLFIRGQQYYQSNLLSMSLASLIGLMTVLAIPSTLKVCYETNCS